MDDLTQKVVTLRASNASLFFILGIIYIPFLLYFLFIFKVRLDFREARTDLVIRHFVAFDDQVKVIILDSTGGQLDLVLLVTYQKAHAVQGKLELRRNTDKGRPN